MLLLRPRSLAHRPSPHSTARSAQQSTIIPSPEPAAALWQRIA